MLNTLLRDNDVLSMACSLEVRPVLLDHKLVELVFSLDDSFKIKNGVLKSVFIDSVKDIIPIEVWQRKKTGFEMPFAQWLNGIFREKFALLLGLSINNSLFQASYLSGLKHRLHSEKLVSSDWLYFVFMSWFSRYEVEL